MLYLNAARSSISSPRIRFAASSMVFLMRASPTPFPLISLLSAMPMLPLCDSFHRRRFTAQLPLTLPPTSTRSITVSASATSFSLSFNHLRSCLRVTVLFMSRPDMGSSIISLMNSMS
ncbi:MAG: hypothetical protein A3K75_03350 [Euryarchaeota archaeon RBG_13_61_15]|nr:MAG: hypothetical protein A3K75_03350 [Euryarchaeota archaeon RBG_13_61_15]